MTTSIYEKYGGYDFFHKIIFELYLDLFDHLEISYHFLGVDMERLSNLQAQYLCIHIGAPVDMYKGRDITQAHRRLKVTEYEFDLVAKRFGEIFKKNGLTDDEVKFIMTFVKSKQLDIVTAKNTPMDRFVKFFYKRWKKLKAFLSRAIKL